MALRPCPQCKTPVSPKAVSCPKCGHPIAKSAYQKRQEFGAGCGVVILVAIGAFVVWVTNEVDKIREAERTSPTCRSDYTKCADNKELVERHYSNHDALITVQCAFQAKQLAKFGEPELPWAPFKTYYPGRSYIEKGVAILIEKDAKYKNGFNASVRTTAICTYDLKRDVATVELVTD
jgi:zinc-ribbon domain